MPSDRTIQRVVNPLFLKLAGRRFRSYSIIRHFGRKTGRVYSNPVTAFPYGDGFVIAILYGNDANWVRDVMATGKCILRTMGEEHPLERPEIIAASQALEAYTPGHRRMLTRKGINEFVWVHRPTTVADSSAENAAGSG